MNQSSAVRPLAAELHPLTATMLAPAEWLDRTRTEYFLQVTGHCMAPDIRNGDFVGVRSQSSAEDGDVVVAQMKNGGRIIKTFRRIDGRDWLVPDNPGYRAAETIPADEATILGVVVGVIHWRD